MSKDQAGQKNLKSEKELGADGSERADTLHSRHACRRCFTRPPRDPDIILSCEDMPAEQLALEAHPGKHLSVLLFRDVTNAKCVRQHGCSPWRTEPGVHAS